MLRYYHWATGKRIDFSSLTWKRRGRYRRIIGQVYLREMWINHELVARGWAWQFKRYSRNKELGIAESEAHRAARGVWAAAESEEDTLYLPDRQDNENP